MTGFEMYALLILDNVNTFFEVTGFISAAGGLLYTGVRCDVTSDNNGDVSAAFKRAVWIPILGMVFIVIATLLPSTKQMATIIVVPAIVNNVQVQELPEKLLSLGIDWLDELKPTKEEIADAIKDEI